VTGKSSSACALPVVARHVHYRVERSLIFFYLWHSHAVMAVRAVMNEILDLIFLPKLFD
jgi:hypothetical protein